MLINIDGWSGSGKSVMLSLLDSHPDIYCSPVHEASFIPFCFESTNAEWLLTKETQFLRKLLSKSYYYRIEYLSQKKNLIFHLSSNPQDAVYIPWEFDFYLFEKRWTEELNSLNSWSLDSIIESIYYALGVQSGLLNSINNPKYFASMGVAKPEGSEGFLNNFPNGKIIHIRRSVDNIIATRSTRKVPEGRVNTGFQGTYWKRIMSSEVEKITNHYRSIDKLSLLYPDRVYIADFSEMVNYPETLMPKIAEFLNINFKQVLSNPTIHGVELKKGEKSFLGTEHDTADSLLSTKEVFIIKLLKLLSNVHKQRKTPLRPVSFIKSVLKSVLNR